MQRRLGSVTAIGRRIGLSDDQGFGLPVLLALIVVIALVVGIYGYITITATPEPYNTMYLLDGNHQAVDYPHMLVAGQNSTFSLTVQVTNHMNKDQTYQVQTKIVKNLLLRPDGVDAQPVDSYTFTLADKASNQHTVTVTENTPGSYAVVYELWSKNTSDNSIYTFTGNYCILNIQVTN
jgi:uncharacterized membrane protein